METSSEKPKLWSPGALTVLAFFMLPISGILGMLNWRVLGNKKLAATSVVLGIISLVMAVLLTALPEGSTSASGSIGIALFVAWVFAAGRPMQELLKTNYPEGYVKRSIWPWWLLVALVYSLIVAAVLVPRAPAPEAAATQVKSMFEKSWKANPPLDTVKIQSITLQANGKNAYKGTMVVEQAGTTMPLNLEAQYKPDTKMLESQFVQAEGKMVALQILPSMADVYRKKYSPDAILITDLNLDKTDEKHFSGDFALSVAGNKTTKKLAVELTPANQWSWSVPAPGATR
jgi:hypothetical protein